MTAHPIFEVKTFCLCQYPCNRPGCSKPCLGWEGEVGHRCRDHSAVPFPIQAGVKRDA